MSFARNIVRDLVEKRLWPAALLLLVAIIAIPLLVGGGGGAATDSETALPEAPAPGAVAPVKPVDVALVGPPAVRSRDGATRDPFRQPRKPKIKPESTASTSTAAPSAGGKPAPATSGGGETTTPPKYVPVDTTPERTVYKVEMSWSQGKDLKDHPILRLTPFGEVTEPAALYLGVSDDKYAMFLLGAQSTSEGEAKCADPGECRVIGLRAGQTQIVEVAREGAEVEQYELEVGSVKRDVLGSVAAARHQHDREHTDGRDVLRGLIQDRRTAEAIIKFSYDRDRGLLHRAGTT